MRFLFYFGHPAHFHLHKNIVIRLRESGHDCRILIKKKDVLEDLLRLSGWDYTNINPQGRVDNKLISAFYILNREFQFLKTALQFKPDLMIGTSPEITHIGSLLRIPSLVVSSDDAEAVPKFARFAYPLATKIITPNCCSVGKWEYKKLGYDGYHELAYLIPKYFSPDKTLIPAMLQGERYFLMRFAKLNAHHDEGMEGISNELALKICNILRPHGKIYITSERELGAELEPFRVQINPVNIHHVMYYADLFIGDSQTMAAEAAVLGTPFIRCNDFVGRLSYLKELEDDYQLGYGFRPRNADLMLAKISELIKNQDIKQEFRLKRDQMLKEKTDVVDFYVNAILKMSAN